MRKLTVKGQKRKLWDLFREYILTRDKNICQWCLKSKNPRGLDVHHIIPKGRCRNAGYYQEENCMVLCDYCHAFKSKIYPHEFDVFQDEWLKKHFKETQENLGIKYQTIVLWSTELYETKYKVIQELYDKLKEAKC